MEPSNSDILWMIPVSGLLFVVGVVIGFWLMDGGWREIPWWIKRVAKSLKRTKPAVIQAAPTQPWIDNTNDSPFYDNALPVEVELGDGSIRRLGYPAIFKPSMDYVVKWRIADTTTQAHSHPS